MDLWSKGLGKRVLNLRLRERQALAERDGQLEIEGVMGAPVFWDYRVSLGERDVLDFLDFLQDPVPVQYLVGAERRWTILATALAGALLFLRRTLFLVFGGRPAAGTLGGDPVRQDVRQDVRQHEGKQEREDNGELGS
jgi:hypothetical protein